MLRSNLLLATGNDFRHRDKPGRASLCGDLDTSETEATVIYAWGHVRRKEACGDSTMPTSS